MSLTSLIYFFLLFSSHPSPTQIFWSSLPKTLHEEPQVQATQASWNWPSSTFSCAYSCPLSHVLWTLTHFLVFFPPSPLSLLPHLLLLFLYFVPPLCSSLVTVRNQSEVKPPIAKISVTSDVNNQDTESQKSLCLSFYFGAQRGWFWLWPSKGQPRKFLLVSHYFQPSINLLKSQYRAATEDNAADTPPAVQLHCLCFI